MAGPLPLASWQAADDLIKVAKLEREESYSDWFGWILEQLGDSRRVLRLLGVQDRKLLRVCLSPVRSGHKKTVRGKDRTQYPASRPWRTARITTCFPS
jgi:hypothetical protein